MNVSSVKNLNGEVFSAIQDASLTDTVQTNSSNWQDITAYQNASANYLTAHQAISAEEWNDCYDNVNTNSGAWGGTPLPITGRDGIDLEVDNGTLYIGASALTGSIDYIETNSANIDEVVTNYQNASGTYLTAHQSLEGYAVESAFEYNADDLITAYNGSAFAGQGGGGNQEVESYVQTNSANIDETVGCVQTNSASWGVGGSGITGVSHDNTLSGDGTVESPLSVIPNETILWSGSSTGSGYTFNLSGNISDYMYIEMYAVDVDGWGGYTKMPSEYFTTANRIPIVTQHYGVQTKNIIMRGMYVHPTSDNTLDSISFGFDYAGTANPNSNMSMKRIVGINRK